MKPLKCDTLLLSMCELQAVVARSRDLLLSIAVSTSTADVLEAPVATTAVVIHYVRVLPTCAVLQLLSTCSSSYSGGYISHLLNSKRWRLYGRGP